MPFTKEERKTYYKDYIKIPKNKQKNRERQKLKYWRDKFIILFPNLEYEELTIWQLKRACKVNPP